MIRPCVQCVRQQRSRDRWSCKCRSLYIQDQNLGFYTVSGETSHCQLSRSLKAASYRSEILQAFRQRYCRDACQIQSDASNITSNLRLRERDIWAPSLQIASEDETQIVNSLSRRTSFHNISWSLEVARLGVIMILSSRNLTGISTALLPRFRHFTRSYGKKSVRLVNRGPGHLCDGRYPNT